MNDSTGREHLPSAVFLDRDGTIIRDVGYLSEPGGVELRAGSADAIRLLNDLDVPVVIVTNQSGIGRGYYGEEQFRAVQQETERLLNQAGASIEAVYFCPHSPDVGCGCRKPGLDLYLRAAEDLSLDLSSAVYAGDRARDVGPAAKTGGFGLLVADEQGRYDESMLPGCLRAPDLLTGVQRILGKATDGL